LEKTLGVAAPPGLAAAEAFVDHFAAIAIADAVHFILFLNQDENRTSRNILRVLIVT
jgi:hypothetical protein